MRKLARTLLLLTCPTLATFGCEQPPAINPDEATANATPEQPGSADADAETPPAAEGDAPAATADAGTKTADQSNLPDAETVLAKNVEAVGGQAKISTIKSYYSETKLDIPAQNMSAVTKLWWSGGDLYAETEMTGIGTTKMWRREGKIWAKDPINGLREVTGKEASQTGWSNSLVLAAEWKDYFSSAKTTGRRVVGDKTLIDVVLSSEESGDITLSFDEATYLVAEQSFTQEGPTGEMPITLVMDEYKDFDGFMSVVSSTMDMKVLKAKNTVVKFELNVPVDAKKFNPPKP